MAEPEMISACGLDCEPCAIRRFPFDEAAASKVVAWYRKMGWLREDEGVAEAVARKMGCRGCQGDREVHWSADCWILRCCVDEKGLQHCAECSDFPCDRLAERSKTDESYGRAFARLQGLRAASAGGAG
jgi:hypothetical protein